VKHFFVSLLFVCLMAPGVSQAEPARSEPEAEIPLRSKFGLYGTLFGEPGVNLLGLNGVYDLDPKLRLTFGYGNLGDVANQLGAGFYFHPLPESRFRPIVGVTANVLFVNSSNSDATDFLDFPSFTVLWFAARFGVHYEAPTGFFVNLTWPLAYIPASDNSAVSFGVVPGLAIGSYF
jgi:hypothetical protein